MSLFSISKEIQDTLDAGASLVSVLDTLMGVLHRKTGGAHANSNYARVTGCLASVAHNDTMIGHYQSKLIAASLELGERIVTSPSSHTNKREVIELTRALTTLNFSRIATTMANTSGVTELHIPIYPNVQVQPMSAGNAAPPTPPPPTPGKKLKARLFNPDATDLSYDGDMPATEGIPDTYGNGKPQEKSKKEWKPDTVRDDIDIMDSIRNASSRN